MKFKAILYASVVTFAITSGCGTQSSSDTSASHSASALKSSCLKLEKIFGKVSFEKPLILKGMPLLSVKGIVHMDDHLIQKLTCDLKTLSAILNTRNGEKDYTFIFSFFDPKMPRFELKYPSSSRKSEIGTITQFTDSEMALQSTDHRESCPAPRNPWKKSERCDFVSHLEFKKSNGIVRKFGHGTVDYLDSNNKLIDRIVLEPLLLNSSLANDSSGNKNIWPGLKLFGSYMGVFIRSVFEKNAAQDL